jgi:hypothetical protein
MEPQSFIRNVNRLLAGSVILLIMLVIMGAVLLTSCESQPKQVTDVQGSQQAMIERGEYLVNAIGCHDCHSPKIMTPHGPEPDPERLLSGYPSTMPLPRINKDALQQWVLFNQELTSAAGPWGVSFAANLTSDETGIGNWTEAQFINAIRHGKYKGLDGSRDLLPPMPWPMYRNLSDDDLKSIFAYLKSTRPIQNLVPAPIAPTDLGSRAQITSN